MALGSTQPLAEMSSRNLTGGGDKAIKLMRYIRKSWRIWFKIHTTLRSQHSAFVFSLAVVSEIWDGKVHMITLDRWKICSVSSTNDPILHDKNKKSPGVYICFKDHHLKKLTPQGKVDSQWKQDPSFITVFTKDYGWTLSGSTEVIFRLDVSQK
jgi:hypothetical protein